MTLRIDDQATRTDTGRQRNANEDSLFTRAALFVVADGMGGAQAGEVASKTAAESFDRELPPGPPEQVLRETFELANRTIHARAGSDSDLAGMGTTITAAIVDLESEEVAIGHVGDSRAYRLRGNRFERLTRDHSLVEEMRRKGQLTDAQAEDHPQRSIITRALGPEPDVQVDTYTLAGRAGDTFLICSDGLTSMISDEELAAILRSATTLDEAAESLVLAANQSGGKDNITVVMFRLGESDGDDEPAAAPPPREDETIAGQVTTAEVQQALEEASPDATIVAPPRSSPLTPAPPKRRRGARLKTAAKTLAVLVVLAGIGTGLYALSRQVYFIGTNNAGLVTLYRGIPYELPFGIDLYQAKYTSGVPAGAIPNTRRKRVLDHEWRGRQDAEDLLRTLERGQLSG
jgi:protein phosphatase